MEYKLLISVIMTYMNDCVIFNYLERNRLGCHSHFHRKNYQLWAKMAVLVYLWLKTILIPYPPYLKYVMKWIVIKYLLNVTVHTQWCRQCRSCRPSVDTLVKICILYAKIKWKHTLSRPISPPFCLSQIQHVRYIAHPLTTVYRYPFISMKTWMTLLCIVDISPWHTIRDVTNSSSTSS